MVDAAKRDNSYWLDRLKRDGRDDLLKMIQDGDIKVYRATVAAGYRKKRDATPTADRISYHYARANLDEKQRFILQNWRSVTRIVTELAKRQRERDKEQKPTV